MTHLVGHHPGQLAHVRRLEDRAGVHVDVPARCGEGVQDLILDDVEAVVEGLGPDELKSVMVIALRSLLEITGKYKDKTREVKDVVYNRLRTVKHLNEVQT